MVERLWFVLIYAVRNMIRDRRRTAFTLLCVAAGVATVVALRALGWMLTDALTANAQGFLRGDVRVWDNNTGDVQISIFGDDTKIFAFADSNIARIDEWAAERDIEVTYALRSELMQTAVVIDGRGGTPALAMSVFIDPQVYPFYDIIRAEEPAGKRLADLFTGPDQIVLGRRLANQTGAKVGDQVRIGAAENLHTVVGIVPDAAESTFDNMSSLMFSFVYLDRAEMEQFGLPSGAADHTYVKLPPDLNENEIMREIRKWPTRTDTGGHHTSWAMTSATEVLEQNEMIADVISRFVLVLSLVGLVIGGVGIINTMVVAVNRRSMEIAILKTLGMQGRGVSMVFMAEAAIAGVVGSLFGIVLGVLLSYIARDLGQRAFTFPLPWRIYVDPMLIGFALGTIITIFFSFMPTIMASRIRPNLVLREGNIPMARAGCLWTLFSFALLIVGFGLLIDLIIDSRRLHVNLPPFLTPGIAGTLGVFVVLAVIVALMWVLVWLMGKLPSFRDPNMRLAIRGLTLHRSRTALSLLALIIGMTALGGTLIMTRSINMLLYTSISGPMGGNMIIFTLPAGVSAIHEALDTITAVNGYRDVAFPSDMNLVSIDGNRNYRRVFDTQDNPQAEMRRARLEMVLGIDVYDRNLSRGKLVEGRYLGTEDTGQPHITIPYLPELDKMGVTVGSEFTFSVNKNGKRTEQTFEVVGIVALENTGSMIPFSLGDSAMQIPLDMLSGEGIPFQFVIVDVKKDSINEAMATVGAIPGLFVFDISIFDSIISRLLNQLAALPLLVAGLSLFAATALIATTVALATMERRRQIAMLKAIGVSRWQALGQLLAENSIIGITGGIISLLPTLLILLLIPSLTQGIVTMPIPVDLVLLMLALSVIITIAATLVTAWGASGEKPLVALRYE